jgi:hypothetical protein
LSTWKKRAAYLAVCSLALTGLSATAGTAAFAADADDTAPTSGAQFDSLAKSLLTEDGVQAVTTDGDGNVFLYTTEPAAKIGDSARSVAEDKSNVVVKVLDAPIAPFSTNDVVGGAGYGAETDPVGTSTSLCSVGFSAWSPAGTPAVISAGHCTDDGTAVDSTLTLPTGDPAGGGATDNTDIQGTQKLGRLAFSQFGGPGNTPGANGRADSVDISVIDVNNNALTTLPQVTDWSTAASEDLSGKTLPVRSVGAAQVGEAVSKSGRTTGFTSGTVQGIGWSNVAGRQVSGFLTNVVADHGDSGGAIIQGDRAVGVVSGGSTQAGQPVMWGANIQNGLALTDGYTVALFLDAPAVTAQGTPYFTGAPVTGTGPAGATLTVTPSVGAPFDVAIDANGAWSFPAPSTEGGYSYSIAAKKGFDKSAATTFNLSVVLAPPVFTSPVNGQVIETSLKAVTGTGKAGATVTLTGDVTGTTTVDGSGNWSVPADLSYGSYSITAGQQTPNPTSANALVLEALAASPATTVAFQVGPVAPVIASPANGSSYVEGSAPRQVTGTGIDGATVSVAVNGVQVATATVANGQWSAPLVTQLGVGAATITATQAINGINGTVASSTVTVTAAAATPAGTPGSPAALANTGAPVMPLLGGGLALLIAAGGMMLIARRNGAIRTN